MLVLLFGLVNVVKKLKKIKLTQGKFAIVGDTDFEWLSQWKWQYAHGYARRAVYDYSKGWKDRKAKRIYMHRLILGAIVGQMVDHINQDSLDNRRVNLRLATKSINAVNSKLRKDNSSGHKGVYRRPGGSYYAQVKRDKTTRGLGTFKTLTEAVKAREKYLHLIQF